MKKILILSHYFPPFHSTQSRINLATARILQKNGYCPIIIASEPPDTEYDNCYREIGQDFEVHRYPYVKSDTFFNRLRGKLKMPIQPSITCGVAQYIDSIARSLISKNGISMIYSISSKGDTHKAALELSTQFTLPWVAEFQDPWLDNQSLSEWMRDHSLPIYRKYWTKKTEFLLKKILIKADLVITESKGHRDALRIRIMRWGGDSNKIIYAYLGSDKRIVQELGESLLHPFFQQDQTYKIGFVGQIYYGYLERAKGLVRCLRILEKEGIRFLFITVGCSLLPRLAEKEGLKSLLPLSRVSYKEAVGIMRALDLGVVIPSSEININSKMFDYLSQGCPILVWGAEEGEMASLVRERRSGIVLDDKNMEDAKNDLLSIIGGKARAQAKPFQDEWFTKENCFEVVLQQIDRLVGS